MPIHWQAIAIFLDQEVTQSPQRAIEDAIRKMPLAQLLTIVVVSPCTSWRRHLFKSLVIYSKRAVGSIDVESVKGRVQPEGMAMIPSSCILIIMITAVSSSMIEADHKM